ncbi:hypothetical protein ACFY0G_33175 [Streptomyces sp. NPDC001552]
MTATGSAGFPAAAPAVSSSPSNATRTGTGDAAYVDRRTGREETTTAVRS